MIGPAAVYARDVTLQHVKGLDEDARKKVASAVAGGASAVASFGLLQASLFWSARDQQDHERWVLEVVQAWLRHKDNPRSRTIATVLPDFLVDQPTPVYQRLSTDALEVLTYLKRFTRLAAKQPEWGR